MEQPGRLHSLDNLRAVMMWLGIVLHAAVNHFSTPTAAIPWRDRDLTPLADFLFFFIHAFRMPVFFILAGYFVALLVKSRGHGGMLRHRLRRLALPFVAFWPVLYIASGLLVMVYMHLMAHGQLGFNSALVPPEATGRAGVNTLHLWFIYYLIWFCLITAALVRSERHIPAAVKSGVARTFEVLGNRWWGWFVLALPLAVVGSGYYGGLAAPNGSFIPNLRELVHNGLFFLFGWYLYRHQDMLLPRYAKNWWKYALAGALLFLVSLVLFGTFLKRPGAIRHIEAWFALFYSGAGWLWSLALIGLFVRHLSKQNALLQYISESSYWVYLVHMLGTLGFGVLIYSLPISGVAKMALNIALTTAVCLASYQLLVRHTRLGVFLNGRRAAPKPAAIGGAVA